MFLLAFCSAVLLLYAPNSCSYAAVIVVFAVVADAVAPCVLLLLVPLLLVAQAASPSAETAASAMALAAVPEVLKLGPPSDGARFGRIADDPRRVDGVARAGHPSLRVGDNKACGRQADASYGSVRYRDATNSSGPAGVTDVRRFAKFLSVPATERVPTRPRLEDVSARSVLVLGDRVCRSW